MKIRILPDNLTNKIAAGEVVERPFSIVKELIENSIDAKSSNIVVEIEDGGKKSISVSDNGIGMNKNNALLSIERYATSKIRNEEDVFNISSLGFRGEAIPSIASVSKFEMVSRDELSESGVKIRIDGGKVKEVTEVGAPQGTKTIVKNLFFNVPARKKFLKSSNTEAGYIAEFITSLALFWNNIQFKLISNKKKVYSFQKNTPFERVLDVLKISNQKNLLPISGENRDIKISGFVSIPSLVRSNSKKMFIYVNGRVVKDKIVQKAVFSGYKAKLVKGQFPIAVIFITIPFDKVDVNVHPAKNEVRFENAGLIYQTIENAVSKSFNSLNEQKWGYSFYSPAPKIDKIAEDMKGWNVSNASYVSNPSNDYPNVTNDYPKEKRESFLFEVNDEVETIFEPEVIKDTQIKFKDLKILCQFIKTYILCEERKSQDLIMIDQHAADEIIVFEKLKNNFYENRIKAQTLLMPVTIELGFRETDFFAQIIEYLNRIGFEISFFGGRTFIIKAIPLIISEKSVENLINEIIEKNISIVSKSNLEDIIDKSLITIACHSAIRSGQKLSFEEMTKLLEDLDNCSMPSNCPHGRPTWIKVSKNFIEKSFFRQV